MKVDLHFHSNHSDGDLSVADLIQMACDNQVDLLSLTDHDGIDAYPEFEVLAKRHGIQTICGLECSVTWFTQELHIVGLGVDKNHPGFLAYLNVQKEKRLERAKHIAERLENIGFSNCYERVFEIAGHKNISRTHFAKLLVEFYKIPNARVAFKDYLGQRGAAYVPSQWINMQETIDVIRAASGVAVLAHPLHYQMTTAQLKGLIKAFKDAKGEGIEVISGFQIPKDTKRMTQFCLDYHLWASTGSDFHRLAPYRATLGQQTALPEHLKPIWQHDAFQASHQLLE